MAHSLSLLAEQDIESISNYIQSDNPRAALKWLTGLEKSFDLLAQNPMMGYLRPSLTAFPVRFWPYGNYLIVYTITHLVEIQRVLHGYRNIQNLI